MEQACFKQSQEATISLCIMIRHCKARRGRRVLVPRPLNSLLCIRQQQQYKQTPQQEPWTPRSLHRCCLLASTLWHHLQTWYSRRDWAPFWRSGWRSWPSNVQLGSFVNFIEFGDLMLWIFGLYWCVCVLWKAAALLQEILLCTGALYCQSPVCVLDWSWGLNHYAFYSIKQALYWSNVP